MTDQSQPTPTISLTEEEQQEIRTIQMQTQDIISELGEIELVTMRLNSRRLVLKERMEIIDKNEEELSIRLQEKYKTIDKE
jgi:hypothetical protein